MSSARHSILETAGRLFGDRGYELVGINEIIEKSQVAKATFYAHFKSKEKLCAEWMRAESEESKCSSRELLAQSLPPAEKVAAKFDSLLRYVEESDYRGCPFSITASMTEASSEVRDVIRDYKSASRSFWQSLALELRKDPEAARTLGDGLFLLYSGAVMEAQNSRDSWPVKSAKLIALELCQA